MKSALIKLINVRTIITLQFVTIINYLAIKGIIGMEVYVPLVTMTLVYYFNKEAKKDIKVGE